MLGCVSTGVIHGDIAFDGTASADDLEWNERLNPPDRAVTTISQSGRPIDWNQTKTPAQDSESDTPKVPSMLPTESVQSVLGIRSVQGAICNERPAGTTIELLSPRRDAVSPAAPARSQETLQSPTRSDRAPTAADTPEAAVSSPRLATRDDIQILKFRRTWRLEVPDTSLDGAELVLQKSESKDADNADNAEQPNQHPAAVKLEAPKSAPSVSPDDVPDAPLQEMKSNLDGQTTEAISIEPPAEGTTSLPVGDRQYYPAFISPSDSQDDAAGQTEQSPSTGPVTGSGLRKSKPEPFYENVLRSPSSTPSQSSLSPIEELPALDELDEMPSVEDLVGPELVAPAKRNLSEETSSSAKALPPAEAAPQSIVASKAKSKANDQGSNEGDSESGDPAELESDDVAMPQDLAIEDLLSTEDTEPARLSPTDIKPLKIVIDKPGAEASTLKNAESEIDLKSVPEEIEPLPVGRLSQLDATGRLKRHAKPTALETISPTIARLKLPVLRTLQSFHARTEHADSRSNWGMMHQIMVYGADTRIIARGRNYSAIAWMAGNNVCRGSRLMTSAGGKIQVREGTGLQGHQAQFLAIMSLVGVPSDYPLYVGSQRFQMKDLVEVEAAACEEGKELTFTLIGLAHYLDTETTWAGARGEAWDFDRLIAAELSQPVVGAACGGTHRLMAFAHALRKRRLEGLPITGQWKRAEDFLNEFTQYIYSLQNRDGSMSTNWFESPEDNGDLARKVQTTGHMVEFLLTHLPDEDLDDIRMTRAITFLVNAMRRIRIDDSAVGYRGHALRSLAMYHRRMYGIAADYPAPSMANQPARRNVRRSR